MSKPIVDPQEILLVPPKAHEKDLPAAERRPAGQEMTRVLKTVPRRMASDPSNGAIACWKHDAVHDVVGPMADHVLMAFPSGSLRFERRSGKLVVKGTTRTGAVTVIPAGSSSRRDIPAPLNVVHLYLPKTTLQRAALEAGMAAPGDLVERSAYPDPITSYLLLSAADVPESSAALDTLFRQQITDLLATRLPVAHAGSPGPIQRVIGGLSPTVLRRAIQRLRSDSDTDVSLAALACEAGLSRFHFCRAFKESTGLSPHAWLRQYRLGLAMNMLRDTDDSIVSVAAELGYASQTAFAAAFKRLTGETPSDWRRRMRSQSPCKHRNRSGATASSIR
ncbi:helix-turn-helix domain-containing protein [Bradyrhizobium erythrophlei]|uniref:helix-turn-helix domain-containing protein n=1 Tax=Bradyrhizobium erythrophlei TaxID=1437360 RepID=UPI0035EE863E